MPALLGACLLALGLTGVAVAASRAPRAATVSKITVTFSDKSLRVTPTTPASGPATFLVRNQGKKVHVLVVKGPGVKAARSQKIAAGRTATRTSTRTDEISGDVRRKRKRAPSATPGGTETRTG
jgi:hypothetical protein